RAGLLIQPLHLLLWRQLLRRHFLHGDGLPRLPRRHRHHLPGGLPAAGAERPFHGEEAFRARSRGLVLALRRRGLAVPVRGHLCVGRGHVGALTEARAHPLASAGGRCPRCGRGRLFGGYLALAPGCTECGLKYDFADAGDGPAVFVVFIVGFIVVAAALAVEFTARPPFHVHLLIWLPLTCVLVGVLLRPMKG